MSTDIHTIAYYEPERKDWNCPFNLNIFILFYQGLSYSLRKFCGNLGPLGKALNLFQLTHFTNEESEF